MFPLLLTYLNGDSNKLHRGLLKSLLRTASIIPGLLLCGSSKGSGMHVAARFSGLSSLS